MKLQRAEEHFGQLGHEHQAFLNRNPYRMLREHDLGEGEGHFVWRAKIVEHPPYEKWASLIGECAHALRSALEHTAYALVNTPNFVTDKTAFPILDDPAKWQSAHSNDLPCVSQPVLTEVEGLQPYHAGKKAADDPLWIVHMLDIIDKHRRLNLVDSTLEGSHWEAAHGSLTVKAGGFGPFKDGAVVGRFKLVPEPPDPRVQMQTGFAFGIAVAKGEPGEGQPALGLLEHLRSYVGGIVARFETFLV
jgi:hypothetical protein